MGRPRTSACKWGHPRTPENTYTYRDGKRECLPCKKRRNRVWRQQNPDSKRTGTCRDCGTEILRDSKRCMNCARRVGAQKLQRDYARWAKAHPEEAKDARRRWVQSIYSLRQTA